MAATELEKKASPFPKALPKQKININDFKPAEFMRTVWGITLKMGQSREDLLRPDFYAHIAARVRKDHRFEVLHEDGNYFAELIVVSASKIGLKVAFLREIDLRDLESTVVDQAEYCTKFRGPRKWSIIRNSDKAVIAEDIDTEGQANQRLKDLTASAVA